MFLRCKLELNQGGNTVEILLERVIASAFRDGFTFAGAFSSSAGNIPPERRVWTYAVIGWRLTLMDGGGQGVGMGGFGLQFGELASVPPAATLSRALLTDRGVEANDPSGVSTGTILRAAEISVSYHPGPVSWRLAAYQSRGASGWFTP